MEKVQDKTDSEIVEPSREISSAKLQTTQPSNSISSGGLDFKEHSHTEDTRDDNVVEGIRIRSSIINEPAPLETHSLPKESLHSTDSEVLNHGPPKGDIERNLEVSFDVDHTEDVAETQNTRDDTGIGDGEGTVDDDEEVYDVFSDPEDDIDGEESLGEYTYQDLVRNAKSRYEITHWPYHLKEAEKLWTRPEREASDDWAELWQMLESFIYNTPDAFGAWRKLHPELTETMDPLPIAIIFGLTGLTERLLRRGADISKLSDGYAPLAFAQGDDVEILKLMLESGADPNQLGYLTPFHCILFRNPNVSNIQLFIKHGGDPTTYTHSNNIYSIHYFAYSGTDPKVLGLLLENGADVNAKDSNGESPLHILVRRSDLPLELLKAFLEAKADVNLEDNESQSRYPSI